MDMLDHVPSTSINFSCNNNVGHNFIWYLKHSFHIFVIGVFFHLFLLLGMVLRETRITTVLYQWDSIQLLTVWISWLTVDTILVLQACCSCGMSTSLILAAVHVQNGTVQCSMPAMTGSYRHFGCLPLGHDITGWRVDGNSWGWSPRYFRLPAPMHVRWRIGAAV